MNGVQRRRPTGKRLLASLVGVTAIAASLAGAAADGPIDTISAAAGVTAQAGPVFAPFDVVNIYNRANALADDVAAGAVAAAGASGAAWAYGRGSSISMVSVRTSWFIRNIAWQPASTRAFNNETRSE